MKPRRKAIPVTWNEVLLGEVIDYGRTEKAEPDEISEDTWVLELEDIEKNTSKVLTRFNFKERQSKSTKNRFYSGDVLYGKLRPYLNKVVFADQDGVCTTEIVPLRGNAYVNAKYLFYWLKHPIFLDYVAAVSHGVNMPRLGTQAGKEAPFVLAPLAEQKRIADKLDSLLSRVDACRERLDQVPTILKRFRESVLAAALSGTLTEGWRSGSDCIDMVSMINSLPPTQKARRGVADNTVPASDAINSWVLPDSWWKGTAASLLCKGVFDDLKDGNHGANHPVVSDFTSTGLSFITAAQVYGFAIDYDGAYKISGAPLAKLRVGFAKSGDVVLTHKGSVGRVGLVDRDCVLTPQTTYYRANSRYVEPKYLMYYMASPPFSRQLDEIKSQTTRDFVPITMQYALVHILPPLAEQREIVRRVEILFAFADHFETRLSAACSSIDRLTPALLAKAFRGELVEQDPNDEPAIELLKRLAASKSGQPETTHSSRAAKARAE